MKKNFFKNNHGKITQENEKKKSFKAMLLRPIKFIIGYGLVYYQVRNLERRKIMKRWESITLKKSKSIRNRKYQEIVS